MQPLKARVRNGRLILDEPTDLPEGTEVEMVFADGDDMDAQERKALHDELVASCEEFDQGGGEDTEAVLARLAAGL